MMGGEDDALDSYINSVSGLDSSSDNTSSDTSSDTSTDTGGDDGATTDGTPSAKTGETASESQQARPDGQQQQPTAKQPTPKGQQPDKAGKDAQPKYARTPNGNILDDKGNIVDERGQIIAPAGKARRVYEDNQRLTRQTAQLQQERDHFEMQARGNVLLNGIPAQYGLTQQDVAQALDFAGRMKRGDAVGVARDLIAMISAQGHNVSELLGDTVGDSIDMRAVRHMLDERLGPIQQAREQSTQEQRQREEGQRNYDRFVSDNEFADVHGDAIVNLMKSQGISVQNAYNRLRQFAADNQFDFSEPLGPQIAARQQQAQRPVQTQRPMPGTGAQTRSMNGVNAAAPRYADPDEDWGSIIKRAM